MYSVMPSIPRPTDPRIAAVLPRVLAYMEAHNHRQCDVVRLTGQSQPQVSKFLTGRRRRATSAVYAICQYAGIELDRESPSTMGALPLSQSARRLLKDNPQAAVIVTLVVESLVPALSSRLRDTASRPPKESP